MFAAAGSEHPDPAAALGECVGAILEQVGAEPDLALIFATGAHRRSIADVATSVRATLRPRVLAGSTAVSVLAGGRESEDVPALAVWAANVGACSVARLDVMTTADGHGLVGMDPERWVNAGGVVLLADPMSFPVDAACSVIADLAPGVPVVGGIASAGFFPGANALIAGTAVHEGGAVAVLLPEEVELGTVVSQGCRPVGEPWIVTAADRRSLLELGGRPAVERLQEVYEGSSPDDRELIRSGLHLGRVVDEHRAEFGPGDFLVRNLAGMDAATGALVAGEPIEVGATVQFHVRDADAADRELRTLLARQEADAALVFTCTGRGRRLFGTPDHDAALVSGMAGPATAGMFCAGEIGPVGGVPFVHGFTASVGLFRRPTTAA